MTKLRAFTIGALLASAVALPIITQNLSTTRSLRTELATLQAQIAHQPVPAEATSSPYSSPTEATQPKQTASEPSRELLRLRGQVGRLRRENAEALALLQESNQKIERLAETNRHLTFFGHNEPAVVVTGPGEYFLSGPKLSPRATTNEVLTELRRIGATLVADQQKDVGQDNYIQALLPAGNDTIRLEFYFDDGKLTSRKTHLQ